MQLLDTISGHPDYVLIFFFWGVSIGTGAALLSGMTVTVFPLGSLRVLYHKQLFYICLFLYLFYFFYIAFVCFNENRDVMKITGMQNRILSVVRAINFARIFLVACRSIMCVTPFPTICIRFFTCYRLERKVSGLRRLDNEQKARLDPAQWTQDPLSSVSITERKSRTHTHTHTDTDSGSIDNSHLIQNRHN